MTSLILTVGIRFEQDVVLARQRARQICQLLGFSSLDQTHMATAVSEIARNAYQYGREGSVDFALTFIDGHFLTATVRDAGPGIADPQSVLDGRYVSSTGMGRGIIGARRLMDHFDLKTSSDGVVITLGKSLPLDGSRDLVQAAAALKKALAGSKPENPWDELQRQNQELLDALEKLEQRRKETEQLNLELEDTNRGVVALYAELDEKAEYLRRASDIKSRFLSNMTHEFRTPLNSILSLSRMLLDHLDGELTADQEKQIRFIRKAATDLSTLVDDLLDLAKIEAGKIRIQPTEFEIRDLFNALRGTLRPLLADQSAVALHFAEAEQFSPMLTDEQKVAQVLRNLISNALKFTEVGEIRVEAELRPPSRVAFTVTDTGVGIPLAAQKRIFEEFVQLEGPVQNRLRGTGLGLPICKKLVELLGGEIFVESEPARGSCFTVVLPQVYPGPAEVSYVAGALREVDPTRFPVLLLVDETETLFSYERRLRGACFQPVPTRSFNEARQALQSFHPLAVIIDTARSDSAFWTAAPKLRALRSPPPPFFGVTLAERAPKTSDAVDEFARRPVDRAWLIDRLSAAARRWTVPEILIVDDDETARYILRGLLSETCFRVSECSSGAEALERIRREPPGALFLDLIMPGVDGFAILRQIRSNPKTSGLPVIVHSAKSLSPDERRALELDTLGILSKDHSQRDASLARIRALLVQAGLTRSQPELATHE